MVISPPLKNKFTCIDMKWWFFAKPSVLSLVFSVSLFLKGASMSFLPGLCGRFGYLPNWWLS